MVPHRDAMVKELGSIWRLKTFGVVERVRQRTMTLKWVLTTKHFPELKKKARLTLRGFLQQRGVDYFRTYAPTVRNESVRLIYALAALLGLTLFQFDVSTAFLNAKMDAEMFAEVPVGMRLHPEFEKELAKFEDPILSVLGAIYGSKQAQMRWFHLFSGFLVQVIGFKQLVKDPCMFVLFNDLGALILALYVGDNLYGAKDSNGDIKKWFIDQVKSRFRLSHEGLAEHFLSEDIAQDPKTHEVRVSHETYINSMLEKLHLQQLKPAITPHQPGVRLDQEGTLCSPETSKKYRARVGMLVFLAGRRPDIAHSTWQLTRFMENPTHKHFSASTRVLRYLSGTKSQCNVYSRRFKRHDLHGYTDADWAGCRMTYKSTSGRIVFMAGPLSWGSHLQPLVATSPAGSEYMAASELIKDILYFREVLSELNLPCQAPSEVLFDNTAAISMAERLADNRKNRHMLIRFHHIRVCCSLGFVRLGWVPSDLQQADMFTKPTSTEVFLNLRKRLFPSQDN